MKFILLAISAAALVPSSFALAETIGPAGCGLGHQLFPKDNQVLAATTNDSTYTQIFGITSGTSACDADKNMAQVVMFVDGNRLALSNEAARGRGETLAALSGLFGCSDVESFGKEMKSHFTSIFGANGEDSIAISKSIRQTIHGSSALAPSCS